LLEKIEPNAHKDLDAIDEAIAEFNTQDPDSISFRYSIDKKGDPSLRSDLQHINVRHLAEVLEKLGVLLDAASTMISVYVGHKRDMQDY
jgi:hypothetical protein